MPAKSKSQQRLFSMALAVRKGDLPRSKVWKAVLDIVDSDMTNKEIEDFTVLKESKRYMKPLFDYINEAGRPRHLYFSSDELAKAHIWEPVKRLVPADMIQFKDTFYNKFKVDIWHSGEEYYMIDGVRTKMNITGTFISFDIWDDTGTVRTKEYDDIVMQIINALNDTVESHTGTPEDIKKFVRTKIR